MSNELAKPKSVELSRPVGNWSNVGAILQMQKTQDEVSKVVGSAFTPTSLARMMLTTLHKAKDPKKILNCTGVSMARALMDCAESGLSPAKHLGHCGFIPYGNELTFQVEYKGLIALAKRSGEVSYITADVVREGDAFEYMRGTEQYLRHRPDGDGPATHYYAIVKFKDGASDFRVMTRKQCEAHRDRYAKGAKRDDSPWNTAFDAMAMKTVLRQLCKFLELSPELTKATVIDEYNEAGVARTIDVPPLKAGSFGFGSKKAEHVEVEDVTGTTGGVPEEQGSQDTPVDVETSPFEDGVETSPTSATEEIADDVPEAKESAPPKSQTMTPKQQLLAEIQDMIEGVPMDVNTVDRYVQLTFAKKRRMLCNIEQLGQLLQVMNDTPEIFEAK